jgi:hypothetical protein
MSADDPTKKPGTAVPAETSRGSGEGAATALKALIRKRNMGETPDPQDPPAPSSPPAMPPLP